MGRHEKKKSKKSKRSKEHKERRRRRDSESESDDGSSSTDEETRKARRARKLARRVEDHLKKHKLSGSGYTDEDNPFGDQQLSQRFVWGKKIEKQLAEGASLRDMTARAELERHRERLEEADKVRKRQAQREAEREAIQAELEMIQRERAAAEAVELERKQERFLLEQAKARTVARLKDGRPKPIDLFCAVVYESLPGLEAAAGVPALDPTSLLAGAGEAGGAPPLSLDALRELCTDVAQYRELESEEGLGAAFWAALDTVAGALAVETEREEALDLARARGEPPPARYAAREAGWHSAIERDVRGMLAGKTLAQLAALEAEIKASLASAADPEYWQAVLARLAVERARAFLRQAYAERVRQDAAQLMASVDVAQALGWGGRTGERDEPGRSDEEEEENVDAHAHADAATAARDDAERDEGPSTSRLAEPDIVASASAGDAPLPLSESRGSPPPRPALASGEPRAWEDDSDHDDDNAAGPPGALSPAPLSAAAIAGREAEIVRHREAVRMAAASTAAGVARDALGAGGEADALYPAAARAAAAAMGDAAAAGDAPFGGEVPLESQAYWWHDKHRPRRPKYFNRVHTGYEWNKYNQTHYDADNPPPKTVQGYKFNIFYPDLLDKAKAPTYRVERDPGSRTGDTCILRFSAGPPYEDIAFRIVNKEWEYNHKKGFKSSFDRGILHLYFNFKRQRYRR
ncbi:hypothetical protein QBZ16_004253 [Prototheca wickerhamii]|uniref:Splicing factor Cactin n=1 Tax=Prototheca wickerhamii TaxID=3111 RepID=A0AAD9IFS5_PROWI|nr:hypothetical protein QBZ16_004253 [Prototheca wickerhamii]